MHKRNVLLVLLILVGIVLAQVPMTMNYQGKLTTPGGIGVNDTLDMAFSVYNTSTGGTPLWTEDHFDVAVVKGLFEVTLGLTNPLDLLFNQQYWLQIEVGTSVLEPRVMLSSSPYALRARYAESTGPSEY